MLTLRLLRIYLTMWKIIPKFVCKILKINDEQRYTHPTPQ